MAVTIIPNVTNWSVTPQNGQVGYFTLMNTWLSESTAVIASLQSAIDAQNTANSEINTLAMQVASNATDAQNARDEAVTAIATLSSGAIDDTTIANNKVYSNQKTNDLLGQKVDKNISSYAEKTTPVDADLIGLSDSQDSFGIKKLSWSNLKATLKTYFDNLYNFYNPTPTIATGTATFTATTNNINLTGIGVGVEIGDVIQISGSDDAKNNSEFTIEVITDANNIIVNQAHANKGTSKNVATRSGDTDVTVKLLAKWYSAPIGLGQYWVNVTKASGVVYTNNTGKAIMVYVAGNGTGSGTVVVGTTTIQTITTGIFTVPSFIVPNGSVYAVSIAFSQWSELR